MFSLESVVLRLELLSSGLIQVTLSLYHADLIASLSKGRHQSRILVFEQLDLLVLSAELLILVFDLLLQLRNEIALTSTGLPGALEFVPLVLHGLLLVLESVDTLYAS